jgi:N-acetylglucosaminyldiphosphoundecaprenol N-acetyl-beta-D-mannosaminyltransferase
MRDLGKKNLLGVLIDALDYEAATAKIIEAAHERRPFAATALAVHGVMTGYYDPEHRHRLNQFDLVTPDGQPVRWALNMAYKVKLVDRVYGPNLMLQVCRKAEFEDFPVYLYGSRGGTVGALAVSLKQRYPGLRIAGAEPSAFRVLTLSEKESLIARVNESGARIVFVGLGCPRQEIFAYEFRESLPMPVVAVGAAFDYHSGVLAEPPLWMQRAGLQWLYRLLQDPRRLWRRYLLLNTAFIGSVSLQLMGFIRPDPAKTVAPKQDFNFG